MKKITYQEIRDAIEKQCHGVYTMSLVGRAREHVVDAVNVGIDPHLEACFMPDRGDSYEDDGHRLECSVSAESMCVLLRRLSEMVDDDEEAEDEAWLLATDILNGLEIECESLTYKIVAPVDQAA